jgi:GntR family transcriptional regulator
MALPKHLVISEVLRERIVKGDYQPEAQLPSESQLIKEFGASRTTIRQALNNLSSQGLVISHQGKGVIVTKNQKVTYSLTNPLIFIEDDLRLQGITFSMHNLLFERVTIPDSVQQIFKLPEEQRTAYVQKKLLLMNGVPGAIDISYVLLELGEAHGEAIQQTMTFPVLEQNGLPINRIEAILECTTATYEIGQYLDVPLGHPLIVYRYTAFTTGNRPVVHGETISRADRFCYSIAVQKSPAD